MSGQTCGTTVATFTTSGAGDRVVRVSTEDELYVVNWHTSRYSLDLTKTYRLSVSLNGWDLGHADVQLTSSPKPKAVTQPSGVLKVVRGSTLPIKFRIEVGALDGVFLVGDDAPFIVRSTFDPSMPVVMLGAAGQIAVRADPTSGRLIQAALSLPGSRVAWFTFDADGRPVTAVYDDAVVAFSHWTQSTVDVAFGMPNGTVRVIRQVPLANSAFTSSVALRSVTEPGGLTLVDGVSANELSRAGPSPQNLSITVGDYTISQQDLERLSAAISQVSCLVDALDSSIAAAVLSCVLASQAFDALRHGETSLTRAAAAIGFVAEALGCAVGQVFACIALIVDGAAIVWRRVDRFEEENQPRIQATTDAVQADTPDGPSISLSLSPSGVTVGKSTVVTASVIASSTNPITAIVTSFCIPQPAPAGETYLGSCTFVVNPQSAGDLSISATATDATGGTSSVTSVLTATNPPAPAILLDLSPSIIPVGASTWVTATVKASSLINLQTIFTTYCVPQPAMNGPSYEGSCQFLLGPTSPGEITVSATAIDVINQSTSTTAVITATNP